MPDTTATLTLEDLGSLPEYTLVPYDLFGHLMPGTHRAGIEESSRRGTFVPGVRMTKKASMHFKAGAVFAYINRRMAKLDVAVAK